MDKQGRRFANKINFLFYNIIKLCMLGLWKNIYKQPLLYCAQVSLTCFNGNGPSLSETIRRLRQGPQWTIGSSIFLNQNEYLSNPQNWRLLTFKMSLFLITFMLILHVVHHMLEIQTLYSTCLTPVNLPPLHKEAVFTLPRGPPLPRTFSTTYT